MILYESKNRKISRQFRVLFSVSFALLPLFLPILFARAAAFAITPAVIDMKGKAREVVTASLRLTNSGAKPVEVYPFVENIDVGDGSRAFSDPTKADLTVSLANWILLNRSAVLLLPGETRDISFSVEINLRAEPGAYHAEIAFAPGATRDEAAANRARAASVAVNLEVMEDIRERMELKTFRPERLFFSGFPVSFSYEFKNTGNRAVQPSGEIRIYNRRGMEVASLPLASRAEAIAPGVDQRFAVRWEGARGEHPAIDGSETSPRTGFALGRPAGFAATAIGFVSGGFWPTGFGKYKAYLDVEYGSGSGRTIQDTVYFWIIPWPFLLSVFLAGAGGSVFLAILWHRRASRRASLEGGPRTRHGAFLVALLLFFGVFGIPPAHAAGENALSLTVTPPLFQLTIGPGESWASSLKVVNANPYDLTVWASAVNFSAEGEEGHGKFTPILEVDPETRLATLAGWILVPEGPLTIPREQSAEIPFRVSIPENASPGGHYAALLVGTSPIGAQPEGAMINVSSFVTSLFFVRIPGEIREEGIIREFFIDRRFLSEPRASFTLRFENRGNVHLQPQGDIVITNIWGKQIARIPINEKTEFGNVLPGSMRKFAFTWNGEGGLFAAGWYRASLTITYGKEARQNVSREISFWVIPQKPIAATAAVLVILLSLIVIAVRSYIRKTLSRYIPPQDPG